MRCDIWAGCCLFTMRWVCSLKNFPDIKGEKKCAPLPIPRVQACSSQAWLSSLQRDPRPGTLGERTPLHRQP